MRPLTLFVLAVIVGCHLDREGIPAGSDQLVVHAVLNPAPLRQTVLLERTLSGRTATDTTLHYDSLDAVVSRGGTPVSGATVVIVSATGDSAVLVEEITRGADGRGRGMYSFRNEDVDQVEGDSSVAIVPGRRYDLHVRTADDETVRGATVVPLVPPMQPSASFTPFDRDQDSVFVWWDPVPLAARYELRIESPRGPFQLFVDSAEYLIAGSLRNTSVGGLPNVFFPGFAQRVSVGAVDRNYFDYYRSANDPFTGSGLVTHLDGALGVFGSYVLMQSKRLTVVAADTNDPIEGRYQRVAGSFPGAPDILQLYDESEAGQLVRLSGNWRNLQTPVPPPGIVGTSDGFHVTLALLRGQSARDTAAVLDLHYDAPTRYLIGNERATGTHVEFRHE